MSALEDVMAERERQKSMGYDDAHNDGQRRGLLSESAALIIAPLAVPAEDAERIRARVHRNHAAERRRLVIAAALIVAEIERIDRDPSP
jgi:hypothetical protein